MTTWSNKWSEVSPGVWEHTDHICTVKATGSSWEVWSTKPEGVHGDLRHAKQAASMIGQWHPRSKSST